MADSPGATESKSFTDSGTGISLMKTVSGTESPDRYKRTVYKVVLTGGPCAGKTTTVARLGTFFENLGWKVYMVPEAATILLCRIRFDELSAAQASNFQCNVLKTILQLETTFFELAEQEDTNTLVICDRGAMDPAAFCSEKSWMKIMESCGYDDSFQLRDARYDQVVHMMTAANGAEDFYQLDNPARSEGLELARDLDSKAANVWVGHPYYDMVDNSTDFESKIRRVIELICKRIGKQLNVNIDDRLQARSKKRKFLVRSLPDIEKFPVVQDFDVRHDYLLCFSPTAQARIRKRGQNGIYTYTHTERTKVNGERVERVMQLNAREYLTLYKQRDPTHHPIHKTRRCFLYKGHYFQLDIFKEPWSKRCAQLLLLETYTTKMGSDLELPDFLDIVRDVTSDPHYSMYYLSAQESDLLL